MPGLIHAPARIWRAFFLAALLPTVVVQAGPPAGTGQAPPPYLKLSKPDQEEGRIALDAFRQSGIPGQYYLEFEIRVLPRRGDESSYFGHLWGARNDQGPVARIEVTTADSKERRLLMQNGPDPRVWRADLGTNNVTTTIVDAMEPLVPGIELTAFDLQMPYVYWTDAVLEDLVRIRGRATHVFLFRPPAAWAAEHRDISGVRAYLDAKYNVPVQTEVIGADGRVVRTLSLVDLKKVGEQYLPKTIDFRNDRTRDKVRFEVVGAALDLRLGGKLFEPGQLAEPAAAPPRSRVLSLGP